MHGDPARQQRLAEHRVEPGMVAQAMQRDHQGAGGVRRPPGPAVELRAARALVPAFVLLHPLALLSR